MPFAVAALFGTAILLLRTGHAVPGWTLAIAGAVLGWRFPPAGITAEAAAVPPTRGEIATLALLVLAAALLRFPGLDSMPPGCWFDEAENGLETRRLMDGELRFYTPRNNGRGALQFWWTAPFFALLGPTTVALRLAVATIGVATVPVAWAVLRRLVGPGTGLVAAGLLAVSGWHVTTSRLGFDVAMTPLFDLLAMGAALRAVSSGSLRWAALAGAAAGLANYGYTASRLTPALVLAAFLLGPGALPARARVRAAAASLAACVLVLAPLALYAATHARAFQFRARQVSITREMREQRSLAPLARSALATARMLHERGDENPRHNRPGRPMLEAATGLFLLLGLVWGRRAAPRSHALALCWLALPLVAGGVLTVRAPHGNRTIAALVPACLLAALGARAAADSLRLRARARPVAATLLLGSAGLPAAHDYFVLYPAQGSLAESFMSGAASVGEWIERHPRPGRTRVHGGYNPSVVRFVSGRSDLDFVDPEDLQVGPPLPGTYVVPALSAFGSALDGVPFLARRVEGAWEQSFTVIEIPPVSSPAATGSPSGTSPARTRSE